MPRLMERRPPLSAFRFRAARVTSRGIVINPPLKLSPRQMTRSFYPARTGRPLSLLYKFDVSLSLSLSLSL
jgi:hypothetical protein